MSFFGQNRLISFPISVSTCFHFDIVWTTRLFFFPHSLLFPSHSSSLGREVQWGVRQETAGPLQTPLQHTFGFTLVLHLLLFFTPLNPSRSVEIITVRLNSECFRFSLSLPGSFPHPSVLGSLESLKTSLSDEHGPRWVHLCLRLCQLWCVFKCVFGR